MCKHAGWFEFGNSRQVKLTLHSSRAAEQPQDHAASGPEGPGTCLLHCSSSCQPDWCAARGCALGIYLPLVKLLLPAYRVCCRALTPLQPALPYCQAYPVHVHPNHKTHRLFRQTSCQGAISGKKKQKSSRMGRLRERQQQQQTSTIQGATEPGKCLQSKTTCSQCLLKRG